MEVLVFIPGIMGSELVLPDGEVVWPPTPLEAIGGYRRTDKLVSPQLRAGGVIESACIDIYGSFVRAMAAAGYGQTGERRLNLHPYDWRRDLGQLSDELDQTLTDLVQTHGPGVEIKLACHSMGGLVARGCLEKARAAPPAWAGAVKLCVFMATPHDGAPLAFARAIGVGGGDLGLNAAQLRKLSGMAGFPAGYQLFPAAGLTPIWRLDDPIPFRGLGLFSAEVADAYPLNPNHLAATLAFRDRLDLARKPDGCRYFAIVSAAHETVTRFDEDGGRASAVKVKGSGDGTVPITSAAVLPIQTAYVNANHVGVAQKPVTHRLLEILLGVREPEVIAAAVAPGDLPGLSLSDRAITEGDAYEVVLIAAADGALGASLRIERETEGGAFAPVREVGIRVDAEGAQQLSLRGPGLAPGRYRFNLLVGETVADVEDLVVMRRNPDA